jgi:hypothetical protein
VEIRVLLMPQNDSEIVNLVRPREMSVSLLPLTPEPCLTLVAEVAPNSDHLDSEDEVQIGRKREVSKAASNKQNMAAVKRSKKHKEMATMSIPRCQDSSRKAS